MKTKSPIEEYTSLIKEGDKGRKPKNKRINPKKVLGTLGLILFLVLGLVMSIWLTIEPTPPSSLLSSINEQEISSTIETVKSIDRATSLNYQVRRDVSNMLHRILMYDSGQVKIQGGSISYSFFDKHLMGMLQRALTAASEKKLRDLNSTKSSSETLESKMITSSNNPISKILRPALQGNIDKAVLNIYMNNGDPPISLALSKEFLIAISIADFSTYFLAYVGTESNESSYLDDDYIQRFVELVVPTFYSVLSYPYKAGNRDIPPSIQEDIALKLCESWNGITPLTQIDKCSKDNKYSNEDSRKGS